MKLLILTDAGHGSDTPGKRSPDGSFREYLWNREVEERILRRLNSWRTWEVEAMPVVKETEDIPLKTRAARVNEIVRLYGKDKVVLLSIHSNAAGNGSSWMSAQGWSAYTTPGQTQSDVLAECLYYSFAGAFPERKIRRDRSDGDEDMEKDLYILSKTLCPAVLLENFFYDNRDECAWLLREDTKDRIADAVVQGLKIYLSRI